LLLYSTEENGSSATIIEEKTSNGKCIGRKPLH